GRKSSSRGGATVKTCSHCLQRTGLPMYTRRTLKVAWQLGQTTTILSARSDGGTDGADDCAPEPLGIGSFV
ncbi:MAG TPA: hypothetical protein VHS97_21535, partial [Isosphaeraceae bacterium]|nr:hypothetical protein [Isosphaeraceae bacterium]